MLSLKKDLFFSYLTTKRLSYVSYFLSGSHWFCFSHHKGHFPASHHSLFHLVKSSGDTPHSDCKASSVCAAPAWTGPETRSRMAGPWHPPQTSCTDFEMQSDDPLSAKIEEIRCVHQPRKCLRKRNKAGREVQHRFPYMSMGSAPLPMSSPCLSLLSLSDKTSLGSELDGGQTEQAHDRTCFLSEHHFDSAFVKIIPRWRWCNFAPAIITRSDYKTNNTWTRQAEEINTNAFTPCWTWGKCQ